MRTSAVQIWTFSQRNISTLSLTLVVDGDGDLIDPEEVAGLVGFLCGPGTDSINGASYVLDGGWTAT